MRSSKKYLFVFLIGVGILSLFSYWSLYTKKGFQLTWSKLARFVPGSLQWEEVSLSLFSRSILVKNLSYTLPEGNKLLQLNHFKAQFGLTSAFRLKAVFTIFEVEGLSLDFSNLASDKKSKFPADFIRELSRRVVLENAKIQNITLQLKEGVIRFPLMQLTYKPHRIGNHHLSFKLSNIEGEFFHQPLSIQEINYKGEFSFPELFSFFSLKDAIGRLNLKELHFGKWILSDFSTQAAFDGDQINFKRIDFRIGSSQYRLKLQLSPLIQKMKGELSSVDWVLMREIPGLSERARSVYEKVKLLLEFDLTNFSPKEMKGTVSLDLKAEQNHINPQDNSLSIQLASKIEQGRFDLTHFQIESEKTNLTGKGWIDLATMELKVPIQGKAVDLKTLIAFFSEQEIVGFADVSGEITGPLKLPDFKFKGQVVGGGYKFLNFGEVNGDFDILKGDMHYKGATPPSSPFAGDINVTVKGIFDNDTRHAMLKVNFNNLDGTTLLANKDMSGKISGFYEMDVFHEQKKGKLVAHVNDFKMYQFHVGDMEVEGDLKNNDFIFPKLIFQPPNVEKISIPRPIEFHFSEEGFKFKGSPFQGMDADGGYVYNGGETLEINVRCQACLIAPLLAALDQRPLEGTIDAKMKMGLFMKSFSNSKMDLEISRLQIPIGDGTLSQAGALKIGYRQGSFYFDQVNLTLNQQTLKVKGSFSTEGALNIDLSGSPDLALLKMFPEYFRDAGGGTNTNLSVKGTMKQPLVSGSIRFEGGFVSPRALGNTIEGLKGKISLDSEKVVLENLEGTVLDGILKVSGSLWHNQFKLKRTDLKAEFQEVAYTDPGTFKLTFSGRLTLTGSDPHFLLAGNLDIVEGRYIKNFDIKDYIIKPAPSPSYGDKGKIFESLDLDLRIKSPGELAIKNNIAEIYLKSDLHVTGSTQKPVYQGALEVLEGEFQYFKLKFEEAKGSIDFRDLSKGQPYVDVSAQTIFDRPTEEIQVSAHIQGFADNLQLSFSSNPPLEKRDILGLILTGALPEDGQKISGADIASSVLASQVTSVIEQPVTGLTRLDIFRLEASDPESKSLTSLVVGKRVTERLTLEFKTDISVQETANSIQAEYLLFDNVLLKAARSSVGRYSLDLTLRFKGY